MRRMGIVENKQRIRSVRKTGQTSRINLIVIFPDFCIKPSLNMESDSIRAKVFIQFNFPFTLQI